MSNKFKTEAHGKINLYLDVLDRMDNGYHNVESVMQSVSLCDIVTLEIEEIDKGSECIIDISVLDNKLPNDKSNIVYKCAKKLIDYLEIKGKHLLFTIEKHIPIAAGMAGGSSDGAAAMRLLNHAFSKPLSDDEMCRLGAQVGADIPFCLTGGTCICRGIGDDITRIKPLKDVFLVSAIDFSSVSTPVAFSLLDEKYGTSAGASRDINEMVNAVEKRDLHAISSYLFNKFESVIIPTNPNIEKIKAIMLKSGAVGTLMSGSGPSVFGIFMDEISQKKALCELENCSINAFLCKTV